MGFNDQVNRANTESFQSSIFRPDVKYKNMAGKGAIVFRLLPAFNLEDIVEDPSTKERYVNPMGHIPFRLPDGSLTDWGQLIYVARFVGHGSYKTGTRRDFVLLKTFNPDGENLFDPYIELQRRASADKDWQYLTADVKGPDGKVIETPSLSKPSKCMIANIVDVNEPDKVLVGLFSTSAYNSLCSPAHNGILCQRAGNATEEQVRQNYLSEWATGDVTDPTTGPVLVCSKGTDKGEMSGYRITLALDVTSKVRRWPINPPELLAYRYNLNNITAIVNEMTAEDMIKAFVQIFNLRSPTGIHEHALLKDVFGSIYGNLIPEPPSSSGSSNTAQGFGGNPAQAHTPARQPAPAGFPAPRPAAPAPQAPQAPQTAQPPAQPAAPAAEQAPQAPAADKPSITTAADTAGSKIPPMTPGTSVGKFDRASFLQRVQAGAKK